MSSLIFVAPQACGKSKYQKEILEFFGLDRAIDHDGTNRLMENGDLLLCSGYQVPIPASTSVIEFDKQGFDLFIISILKLKKGV